MVRLGDNRWGKSEVRVSKVLRGDRIDGFVDVTVQVLLQGDVEAAHTGGDNSSVLPTDTMRNTIYGIAQSHLSQDLEAFGVALTERFLGRADVHVAEVTIKENLWRRTGDTGFTGGGSEHRVARLVRGNKTITSAGIEGLVVLKTRDSAFEGFPRDEYTILPEAADRLLATSITAHWDYSTVPADTTATWNQVRTTLLDGFFSTWSASVQHQGYMMGQAVVAAVAEISQITFHLPNQHHLPYDLTRFGLEWERTVFHPVSEPYGDIELTVISD
ncbi:MAG: urate oxidase [Acidimicrobiia bacterium]